MEQTQKGLLHPNAELLGMEGTPAQHHPGSCSLPFPPKLQASSWDSPEARVAKSLSLLGHVLS